MEKIKLILSAFGDAVSCKIINTHTNLDDSHFLQINEFLNELDKINKKPKEEEFLKLLNKYDILISKVKKMNKEVLHNSQILTEGNT
jgi:hypothetical protein